MKRFHVHVSVEDLQASIRFYSTLFATAPAVQKPDYAKWMLDDPRVNFAISQRGQRPGVDHLGFQMESAAELQGMREQLQAADAHLVEQTGEACCYARSDKYWVTDTAGIAWETFHTLGTVPMFGEDTRATAAASACCASPKSETKAGKAACCAPVPGQKSGPGSSSCC